MRTQTRKPSPRAPQGLSDRAARARARVMERYRDFIRPVLQDPLGCHLDLTIRSLKTVAGMSADTIAKHGLGRRMDRVARWRDRRRAAAEGRPGSRRKDQIVLAREETAYWRQQYNSLNEAYANLQYALAMYPNIDHRKLMEIVMEKPHRAAGPARSRRSSSDKRRRR